MFLRFTSPSLIYLGCGITNKTKDSFPWLTHFMRELGIVNIGA